MAQAVSRRPLTAKVRFRSLFGSCEICWWTLALRQSLLPVLLVFPMMPPMIHIHLLLRQGCGQLQASGGDTQFVGTCPRPAIVYTCFENAVGGGGVELTITPLFTNTTFVLLQFIKVAVLCYLVLNCII
jgi:hypothetical protein